MTVTREAIDRALATVIDPEIRRPITDLGMVKSVEFTSAGVVDVEVFLTIKACPMQDRITDAVREAVSEIDGVTQVNVALDVMSDEQRTALREKLQGPEKEIRFNKPGSMTRVYAIASGKGGVGKSSVTVNLATTMAAAGLSVGILDADIYGHSIPDMLGITAVPLRVDSMIMPPQGHGVSVMSMLPLKRGGRHEPLAMRGPMLHKYLESFLAEVWWGDLDVLLLDLPPGTGDIALSVGHLLPGAELVVVTTPQQAAADVAVRAGMMAEQLNQKVAGVIENMSSFACPHCGDPIDMFGSGGGHTVSEILTGKLGYDVPLIAQIPFDPRLRLGGDTGAPLGVTNPEAPACLAIESASKHLLSIPRNLIGKPLSVVTK